MIKVENIEVYGFGAALRGMRNPKNSWERSDTQTYPYDVQNPSIGMNDLKLMKDLISAGTEHRKFLRMIHVQMDVTAPFYWWKEFDTYKVGTTANSCSTMHKLTEKPFTIEDFSTDHLTRDNLIWMQNTVIQLNYWRDCYLVNKDKECWWQLIQLLPASFNQRRTLDFDYETALRIYEQRKDHKLDEWHRFCDTLLMLPYLAEIRQK